MAAPGLAGALARRAGGAEARARAFAAAAAAAAAGAPPPPPPPRPGDAFSCARAFTEEEVAAFARLSGDANPLHRGPRAVVPGLLLGSLFPGLVGSAFPGALYLSQRLSFRRPVLVGEPVAASVTVTRASGSRVLFAMAVEAEGGGLAVDGTALARIERADGRARGGGLRGQALAGGGVR